jgi:hypothetical protein
MTGALKWALAVAGLAVLVGCSGGTQPSSGAGPLSEDYEGALPVQTQLVVGTLKLEEGEWAVSAEQAEQLIPLWKAVRSLSSSDTAAEAEFEALMDQVQETMTAEQMQAIAAMQLTQEDLFGEMQELGIGPGGAEGGDQVFTFGGQASGEGQAAGGGPPEGFIVEGGPPEGFQGGGPGGGGQFFTQDLDPDQIATLQAERGGQAPGEGRAGLFLIEPLLELLEARAGA